MADAHSRAERARRAGVGMEDRTVLDVRLLPDRDEVLVSADDRARPNGGSGAKGHPPDDRSALVNEGVSPEVWGRTVQDFDHNAEGSRTPSGGAVTFPVNQTTRNQPEASTVRTIKSRLAVIGAVLVTSAGIVAGCGGSDASEAKTPGGAVTGVNSAVQTDKDGKFIETEPSAATTTDKVDPAIAAGQTVFENSCQGCHANLGKEAGAGPVLAGNGRTADRIESQIVNGGGSMAAYGGNPPIKGEELANLVKFVESIQ
jgi:mono/diheme cytochrome c family protein